jgi:chromosome segregation ATPase
MSLQQLKKELENIRQKINSRNSRAEYILSNTREDFKREIDRIGERLRESVETCVMSEEETEELIKKIQERAAEVVKDPYFQRYIRGF